MANWWYRSDEGKHGPIPGSELRRLARKSLIGPETLVKREGMEKWVRARKVKGLFDAVEKRPSSATAESVAQHSRATPQDRGTESVPRDTSSVKSFGRKLVFLIGLLIVAVSIINFGPKLLSSKPGENAKQESTNDQRNDMVVSDPPALQSEIDKLQSEIEKKEQEIRDVIPEIANESDRFNAKRKADGELSKLRRTLDETKEKSERLQRSKKLADELFGIYDIQQGAIQLSKSLREKHSASIEFKGRDYERISSAHGKKDWLGVINVLNVYLDPSNKPLSELPSEYEIEQLAHDFAINFTLNILLKCDTDFKDNELVGNLNYESDKPQLCLAYLHVGPDSQVDFSWPDEPAIVNVIRAHRDTPWRRHPDGIGYYRDWQPGMNNTVVMYTSAPEASKKAGQTNIEFSKKMQVLRERIKLGEANVESATKELLILKSRLQKEFLEWARNQ